MRIYPATRSEPSGSGPGSVRSLGLYADGRLTKDWGVRKLTFGMNVSLDGYVAAPGDDLGWGVPSDELFQWWSDRVGSTGLALYGRRLWETMSSHWPTADQQPGVTPAHIEFPAAGGTCRRWCSPRLSARLTGTPPGHR